MTKLRKASLYAGMALFMYCFLLLFLMAAEDTMLYPRGGRYQEHPDFPREDVWLQTSDNIRLHAWFCPSQADADDDRATSVVLFCHGNAGELTSRRFFAERWSRVLGADVLLFDYRGYGRSDGRPHERGLYLDAQAAYDWLLQRGYAPEQIIVVGNSLGAAVAAQLAAKVNPAALVLENPFTSAPDVAAAFYPWVPTDWLMRNRLPTIEYVGDYAGPIFLSRGEQDEMIPSDHLQSLFDRANGPKQMHVHPGAGHNTPPQIDYYFTVREFLRESASLELPDRK